MPTPSIYKSSRSTLWYPSSLRPNGPKRSRRYSASALINGLNAIDYWAHGNDPTYLIGCMRVQISNLWDLALQSDLPQVQENDQKTVVVTLLKECRDALFGYNSLSPLQAQQSSGIATSPSSYQAPTQAATQAFAQPVPFAPTANVRRRVVRMANTQSHIESNAKAALGAMAYLLDSNLFGEQGQMLYAYIQYRLQQVIALAEGSVTLQDVVSERQRLISQQQQAQGLQAPQAGWGATYPNNVPAQTASPSQQSVPSPVEGLEPQSLPWDGVPNTDEEGNETVGSHAGNWYSLYGTTLPKFAARCARWMQANGGQAALVGHLRANGVPENVIGEVLANV